jgi:hypothetical protein
MKSFFSNKNFNRAKYFDNVYHGNLFHGKESLSGEGSSLEATKVIRQQLPGLLRDLKIETMLDVPCGDLHWMKELLEWPVEYTGADVSRDVINSNRRKFPKHRFVQLDAVEKRPNRYDLIFCRDLLVHLPLLEAMKVIQNFCESGSSYLLTTTFIDRTVNEDFSYTPNYVQWRPLNLSLEPFNFPAPLSLIIEECFEGDGLFADKSLALFDLDALRSAYSKSQ